MKKRVLDALGDDETEYRYLPATEAKKGKRESVYTKKNGSKVCIDKVNTMCTRSDTKKRTR